MPNWLNRLVPLLTPGAHQALPGPSAAPATPPHPLSLAALPNERASQNFLPRPPSVLLNPEALRTGRPRAPLPATEGAATTQTHLLDLPLDVWQKMFGHLTPKNMAALRGACHATRDLVDTTQQGSWWAQKKMDYLTQELVKSFEHESQPLIPLLWHDSRQETINNGFDLSTHKWQKALSNKILKNSYSKIYQLYRAAGLSRSLARRVAKNQTSELQNMEPKDLPRFVSKSTLLEQMERVLNSAQSIEMSIQPFVEQVDRLSNMGHFQRADTLVPMPENETEQLQHRIGMFAENYTKLFLESLKQQTNPHLKKLAVDFHSSQRWLTREHEESADNSIRSHLGSQNNLNHQAGVFDSLPDLRHLTLR